MAPRSNASRLREAREFLKSPFCDDPDQRFFLTIRQAQVARLAAMGATNEEIAAELGVPANTVASHMRDVKHKTGMGKFELTRWVFDRLERILR